MSGITNLPCHQNTFHSKLFNDFLTNHDRIHPTLVFYYMYYHALILPKISDRVLIAMKIRNTSYPVYGFIARQTTLHCIQYAVDMNIALETRCALNVPYIIKYILFIKGHPQPLYWFPTYVRWIIYK